MIYGYMRVSTEDQKNDMQEDALKGAGCEYIFADTISGSTTKRPELDKLLKVISPGDTLIVWKLDRLGRKASHLYELVENLNTENIHFISLRDQFDTSTPAGWAMFQMMGVFAELERNTIRQRTKEGIAASRARGEGSWGRKTEVTERHLSRMLALQAQGKSLREIAKQTPYSHSTVRRALSKGKDLL